MVEDYLSRYQSNNGASSFIETHQTITPPERLFKIVKQKYILRALT